MKDKLIAKLKELNVKLNRFVEYLHTAVEFGEDADWEEVFDHKLTKIKRLESEIASLESDLAKDGLEDAGVFAIDESGPINIEEPEGVTAKEVLNNIFTKDYPWRKNEIKGILEAMESYASSKQIDKRKFLKDFNSWMCGKQYDGRIPLIDKCITEYLDNK